MTAPYGHGWDDTSDWDFTDPADAAAARMVTVELPVSHIVATCSRSFKEWAAARTILTRVYKQDPGAVLMHGDCEDGDRQIAGMWRSLGGVDDPRPAAWSECGAGCPTRKHRKRRRNGEEYCPYAGPRRNTQMVETSPRMVLAFLDPKSRTRGAFRTVELAEAAGITSLIYRQEES
jgi:hypothetical protein